jgi:uncharacterized protein (TIGR02118 family)
MLMTKISILYPYSEQSRFDMEYYVKTHMPQSIERLSKGAGFHSVSVERGVSLTTPGSPPAYVAMCQYVFESMQHFLDAFLPHAEYLQGDMPNYTDIVPIIQISEVEIMK